RRRDAGRHAGGGAVRTAGVAAACALALAMTAGQPAVAQLVADLAHPAAAGAGFRIERAGADVASPDGDGFAPVRYAPGPAPAIAIRPASGFWDWSPATAIRMHLQNAMAWPVTVQLQVTDASGGQLAATLGLPPGGPVTLSLPLAATHPRRWGMTAGPPVPWLQDKAPVATALSVEGRIDPARITALRIGMPAPAAEQTLRIGKVFLEPQAGLERQAYAGIVDAFGQYTRGEWPEKYVPPGDAAAGDAAGGDAEAFRRFAREHEHPAGAEAGAGTPDVAPGGDASGLDRYGGLAGASRLEATGRFRIERVATAQGGRRWVLVTPEGHPFFSIGVNAVQMENSATF